MVSSKGLTAIKFVLNPNFSACAIDSSVVPDFEHFNLKIKPEAGKTLIWPAEWTHAHRGTVLKGGKKYIITGWLHFTD